MKTLAAILPMKGILAQAAQEVSDLTQRHDIPQGPGVPEDLRDRETDFLGGLPNGGRISGRLMVQELNGLGWRSPVDGLLMLTLPLLVCMIYLLQQVPVAGPVALFIGGALILGVLALLSATQEMMRFFGIVVMCLIVPAVGLGIDATGAKSVGGGGGVGAILSMAMQPGMAGLFFIGIAGLIALVIRKNYPDAPLIKLLSALVFFGLLISNALTLDGVARSFLFVSQGVMWPYLIFRKMWKERAHQLAVQGHRANLESNGLLAVNSEARTQQIKDALADPTPLIEFGTAKGAFKFKRDNYSPDAGLPIRMSFRDMMNSILIVGASGSGKTVLIRNLVIQALKEDVGILMLCGKAELPLEFMGLKNYTIIRPGHGIRLGLIEGLGPEQMMQTIFQNTNTGTSGDSGEGSDGFFKNAGYEMGLMGAILLEALIDAERKELNTVHEGRSYYTGEWVEANRKFAWTIGDFSRLMDQALAVADHALQQRMQASATGIGDAQEAAVDTIASQDNWFGQYVHKINVFLDKSERSSLLEAALDYFTRSILNLDEKTKSNIQFTVKGWFQPLTLHRDLKEWSETEHGMDLLTPLRGGRLGVALPKNIYGKAARMIQSLIKVRVQTAVLQRGNNKGWRGDHIGTDQKPQTPVVIVMDEAQDLVDPNDGEYIRKCRAFEGITIFGTQSIENFYESMGEKSANAFISNCNNRFALRCSSTTAEWFCNEMGTAFLLKWQSPQSGIGYISTMAQIAMSPMLDPTHPSARYYKTLIRRGALKVNYDQYVANIGSDGKPGQNKLSHAKDRYHSSEEGFEFKVITQAEMEERELLTPGELMRYTAERGVAIASFNRAGVPRRDAFKIPMLDPAKELGNQWIKQ
jgi:hypothetical protein